MKSWRRLALPAITALIAFAILIGLGIWQVQRLAWKEALIARVTARLAGKPVSAPGPVAWPGLALDDLEYLPVVINGTLLNDREIDVVYTLTEPKGRLGGVGYLVMTPLLTADGWIAYVNRGFVPADRKSPETRKESLIEGATTITGLLRQPRDRSWFTPGDRVAANEWFSRDPELFAKAGGLPPAKAAPYIIDARFDAALPGGLPQGGETIIDFPNSHLQYAITWFGLAASLLAVFIAFARGRLRGEPAA